MKVGLTSRIAVLAALPVAGALIGLLSFARHEEQHALLDSTLSVASRQRLLANELVVWAGMVAAGQDEDRAPLAERVGQFDAGVRALRWGGTVGAHPVAPPTPALLPAVARLEATWQEAWQPRLLWIARGPPEAEEPREAAAFLARRDGSLLRAAEAVLAAIEADSDAAHDRQQRILGGIALGELLLVLVALWLAHGRIVRPIREVAAAARRAQAGDYTSRVQPRGDDEIGQLAAAFNDAAVEIGRLLSTERRYHDIIEQFGDGVVMVGTDGRVSWANPAAERLSGRAGGGLVGLPFLQLLVEPQAVAVRAELEALLGEGRAGPGRILRAALARPDGGALPAEVSLTPHRVGSEVIVTCIVRDVSERENLTARMMQMDRMIAVGTLAAGVAHELNNPLAYVVANLGYVAEELPRLRREGACGCSGDEHGSFACASSIDSMVASIREAQHGATRMRHIIADLKNFSRSGVELRSRFEVGRILESSINMAWNEIRHRARLTKELEPGALVEANEARIGQVFLNLLVNAAHAIPEGAAASHEIHLAVRREGGSVVVTIRDTGAGIPAEILPRIFDPFFTTKPVGQGTGLGLAICSATLHAHGGSIAVESVVGRGTTFRVTLPAAPSASADPDEPAVPSGALASARRGRVLVVDDEAMIASALKRMLDAEHQIECATDGRDALALLRSGRAFDVILTDLMMPEFDGIDLYEALAREWPGEEHRLIFMSGGAFTPRAQAFFERVENRRVEKPFDPHTLRALVRERVQQRLLPHRPPTPALAAVEDALA